MPCRRRGAADQRTGLAGHAPVAQPQLGPSETDRARSSGSPTRRKQYDGWNGLLVGDISQPRGGPMLTGHASHQIGLDADIWLNPMPDRDADRARSARRSAATSVVKDRKTHELQGLDGSACAAHQARRLLSARSTRIFVHPPIKAELCRWATGDRSWLAKVRPYYGHDYHFHIRIKCPTGSAGCKNQPAPAPKDGTGCGEELAYWMGEQAMAPPKPRSESQCRPSPSRRSP